MEINTALLKPLFVVTLNMISRFKCKTEMKPFSNFLQKIIPKVIPVSLNAFFKFLEVFIKTLHSSLHYAEQIRVEIKVMFCIYKSALSSASAVRT